MVRSRVIRLKGITRSERGEATVRLRDAFSLAGAWITDVRFFSGVQTVLFFETRNADLPKLAVHLQETDLVLEPDSWEALHTASNDEGEVEGSLVVSFLGGNGDLSHDVPAVPG